MGFCFARFSTTKSTPVCFSAIGTERKEISSEAHVGRRSNLAAAPVSRINAVVVIAVVAWPLEIVAEVVKEVLAAARGYLGVLLHLGDAFAFRVFHTFLRASGQFGGLLGVHNTRQSQFSSRCRLYGAHLL